MKLNEQYLNTVPKFYLIYFYYYYYLQVKVDAGIKIVKNLES